MHQTSNYGLYYEYLFEGMVVVKKKKKKKSFISTCRSYSLVREMNFSMWKNNREGVTRQHIANYTQMIL